MGSYHIIKDHAIDNENVVNENADLKQDYISTNPHWILMIVRYSEPLTSSMSRLANRTNYNTGNIALDDDQGSLNRTRSPLIITSSCVSLDVSGGKNQYTQSLQAVLKPGKTNFLSGIMPGDWVLCWMMNSKEKYNEILEKLRKREAANGFNDGLKFVGRVQDIRKILTQSPAGLKTLQYNLAAVGFGELDSSIFFDPNLARVEPYIERYLQNMNIAMNDIYTTAAEDANSGAGGIDINKVIPAFIKAFFGEGVSGVAVDSGGLPLSAGASIATKEAPFAYVIPESVANILSVTQPSKGVYCYADILEVIQGLQKYQFNQFPQLFYPTGTLNDEARGGKARTRHVTSEPLKGVFLPIPTSFDNKTVWNLLHEYLNPAINEMYTAMKYTPSGRVMPTLIIRQYPFSSPILNEKLSKDKIGHRVTAFHELPRWVATPALIRGMDIGRSDGARTNFIHITAQPNKENLGTSIAEQLVRDPPISDPQDIKRHGLRAHMGHISAAVVDGGGGGPGLWMTIKADFLLGQHMMLTGVCSMVGVTSPIVPGDNFEFDNVLFHIESVTHHCAIVNGVKTFTTQLSLTHGVRADVPSAVAKIPTTRVKKKGHVRGDMIQLGESLLSSDKSSAQLRQGLDQYGGLEAYGKAVNEQEGGFEVDIVAGEQQNLDLYLYSGIDAEDNGERDPGLTIEVDPEHEE